MLLNEGTKGIAEATVDGISQKQTFRIGCNSLNEKFVRKKMFQFEDSDLAEIKGELGLLR